MKEIINCGIYKVNYTGNTDSEFSGDHPSIIIRTLKEYEIFMVVPLTTYTKERWEKLKGRNGKRLLSTNSIARIDKLQIIHVSSIKNRWMVGNSSLKVDSDELKELNNKVNEYIDLSSQKAHKEYKKYMEQFQNVFNDLNNCFLGNMTRNNIFILIKVGTQKQFKCKKSELHWVTEQDMKEMCNRIFNTVNYSIDYDNSFMTIKVN
jgi:uncharacterized protein YifN (PemK superfamily)